MTQLVRSDGTETELGLKTNFEEEVAEVADDICKCTIQLKSPPKCERSLGTTENVRVFNRHDTIANIHPGGEDKNRDE